MTVVSELAALERPQPPAIAGSGLARNSVFNLLGLGIPLIAAFFAIPALIRALGTDRFGVLTLAWILIGYFSLFDLGLGRALTQVVAARLSETHSTRATPLVWPALGLMFVLGLAGAVIMSAIAPWMVRSVLKITPGLQTETLTSFYILAAAIPLVVVTSGMAGILTAFHRFDLVNAIRAPMGIFTFAAPLAVLPFFKGLVGVTAVLAVGRILGLLAHMFACRSLFPPLRSIQKQTTDIKPLFQLGAWMTVSNVISPLLAYLDRFVIGAIVSVAAVAYYATPFEMVTKVLIIPGAVMGVLFPAFAASYQRNPLRMVRLFTRGTTYIALVMFPLILAIAAFAHEALRMWLGDEFAFHGTRVLQWLAIGVFINSVAQVFSTFIQGIGRPDLNARLHVIELPIYLVALWWAIHTRGILGAAVAWTGRVAVDGLLLYWMSARLLPGNSAPVRRVGTGLVLSVCALAAPLLFAGLAARASSALLVAIIFGVTAWRVVLTGEERASLLRGLPTYG